MRAKQYKGHPYGANFTKKEQKAMEIEIRRQIAEDAKKYENNVDVSVLYFLYKHLNFGEKRLRRAWEQFTAVYHDLIQYYEMPDECDWLMDRELKAIGVDVSKWNAERELHNGI